LETEQTQRVPFPGNDIGQELDSKFNHYIAEQLRRMRGQYLSPSNMHRLKHGRRWYSLYAYNPDEATEAGLHSTETAISKQRIVDHDLTVITEVFKKLSDAMHSHFMRTMLQTMEEATAASGNVVIGTQNFRQTLEEMLSKIKFGVDQYGVPMMPEALVTPALMQKIRILATERDEEHSRRIEEIADAKKRAALTEEAQRIARYRLAGC
jgi:hypothetical protein